jgi:phosphohistidine phosphatase
VTDSRLIIMRHAKSDWHADNSSDFDRPLATRGKRDAVRMGKWLLAQELIPDCFICSSARRARQTAALLAKEIKIPKSDIISTEQIYAASLQNLLGVLEAYSNDVSSLMIVGHNPGLDELLRFLAIDRPTLTTKGKLMTTSAIAVLNFGDKAITTTPQSASLEYLTRPKELEN